MSIAPIAIPSQVKNPSQPARSTSTASSTIWLALPLVPMNPNFIPVTLVPAADTRSRAAWPASATARAGRVGRGGTGIVGPDIAGRRKPPVVERGRIERGRIKRGRIGRGRIERGADRATSGPGVDGRAGPGRAREGSRPDPCSGREGRSARLRGAGNPAAGTGTRWVRHAVDSGTRWVSARHGYWVVMTRTRHPGAEPFLP